MQTEVLIFGSNGALGKGIAETFLKKDYDKVFLLDFKNDLTNLPANAEFIKVEDLSVEENIIRAFDGIKPSGEKLFFLYTTIGGFFGGKKFWETNLDDFENMFKLNINTSFLIAKNFAGIVKDSAGGSAMFTAAYTGITPEKNKAAYGASKASLIHFIKTASAEGAEINMSINGIAPYIIDTPANRGWMADADYGSWLKPAEIGEFTHNIFQNFHFINGNIFEFKHRFKIAGI